MCKSFKVLVELSVGEEGLEVMQISQAASKSLKNAGAEVEIHHDTLLIDHTNK